MTGDERAPSGSYSRERAPTLGLTAREAEMRACDYFARLAWNGARPSPEEMTAKDFFASFLLR